MSSTFTEPELRAAVEAAENWGTYVATHAYTPVSIQRSIAAGVKCIEHGHLMDEETAKLMAEKGIWLSTQPFLNEEGGGGAQQLGASEQVKMKQVIEGTDNVYRLAKKYHLKTAFGTEILRFPRAKRSSKVNRLSRARSLVHTRRSAGHGDVGKCRATCSVQSPQSIPQASLASLRRAPWPTLSRWWMAIHLRNSILSETPAGISMNDYERREDLQEHSELTSTFW